MVHPDDGHYFAFSTPGLGQLQPTRMPRGSYSALFSFTELMYLVLGCIPPYYDHPEIEFLLKARIANGLLECAFFILTKFLVDLEYSNKDMLFWQIKYTHGLIEKN